MSIGEDKHDKKEDETFVFIAGDAEDVAFSLVVKGVVRNVAEDNFARLVGK